MTKGLLWSSLQLDWPHKILRVIYMHVHIGQILNLRNSMGIQLYWLRIWLKLWLEMRLHTHPHKSSWAENSAHRGQNHVHPNISLGFIWPCSSKHDGMRKNAFGLWSSMNQYNPVWKAPGCHFIQERPNPSAPQSPCLWNGLDHTSLSPLTWAQKNRH